jgi:hypothetical protein
MGRGRLSTILSYSMMIIMLNVACPIDSLVSLDDCCEITETSEGSCENESKKEESKENEGKDLFLNEILLADVYYSNVLDEFRVTVYSDLYTQRIQTPPPER